MRTSSIYSGISARDPLLEWAGDLRTEVLGDLTPSTVGAIASIAATGALSTAAAVGVLAALEGSAITTAAVAATSHTALKISALGLSAALAGSGAAAVTGNLPDAAQRFVADAAAHIGISLPRPETGISVDGSLDLSADNVIDVGTAGPVGIRLDPAGLRLTGIEGNTGFTARVVSETSDAIIIEFRSALETTSVLVTRIGDDIASSVTTSSNVELEVEIDG